MRRNKQDRSALCARSSQPNWMLNDSGIIEAARIASSGSASRKCVSDGALGRQDWHDSAGIRLVLRHCGVGRAIAGRPMTCRPSVLMGALPGLPHH